MARRSQRAAIALAAACLLISAPARWPAASQRRALAVAGAPAATQAQPARIDYARQVHPILATKCLGCHSEEKRSGGLSLSTYDGILNGGRSGAAVKPGASAESLLVRRVSGAIEPRMPLSGPPLGAAEIALIRAWIDQGARATATSEPAKPKWEAPLGLAPPPVPPSPWAGWSAPIDRFVAAYMGRRNLPEPPIVSDAVFARRAYLDIQGLLPPPEELQAFLDDRAPDKRRRLATRLLGDNQKYAEHWISFWNDLLRNEEGVNYHSETASRKSITDWLLASLRSNLPYDQFAARLLNPKVPGDPDGFLVGVNWRGVVNASQTPAMQAAQNTAQIFLGINLKCNSCHDSFISKWKLRDAYGLAGYFSAEEKLQLYRCDVEQAEFTGPRFLYPELDRTPASASIADRRAAAAAIFTDPRNGRLPRTVVNRVWQQMFGRGIVEHPDEMDEEPWSPELLDWLAADFVASGYDLKHLLAAILSSRAYQAPAVPRASDRAGEYIFRGPEIRRLTAEQFADAIGAITGDWHVYQPRAAPASAGSNGASTPPATYTREWRVAASPLTRALGRPVRDQVYSMRDSQATTLQALELVNGRTLTHWLFRGARKMLGELPPEPRSRVAIPLSGRGGPYPFDIDVSKASRLWLLVEDTGSYSPEKVEAVWTATLVRAGGEIPLSSLTPLDASGLRPASGGGVVRVKTPSAVVYDVSGQGFMQLKGMAGIENREITSDLNPRIRFFIFDQEPNMERLMPVAGETPLPPDPVLKSGEEIVDRVFRYALGRAPSAVERRAALAALEDPARAGRPSAQALADLLWAVMMKPEFQLIY